VAIARRPLEQWQRQLDEWAAAVRAAFPDDPHLSGLAQLRLLADALQLDQAALRCTIALVAVERYRLATGRLPATLDELVPRFLAAVPLDPYDGQPLRLRATDEGLTIYSVGPDGQDNGGTLDPKEPKRAGTDVGCRLWRPDRRHQPPLPGGDGPGEAGP
jgi:hypothetical protein